MEVYEKMADSPSAAQLNLIQELHVTPLGAGMGLRKKCCQQHRQYPIKEYSVECTCAPY